MNTAIQEAIALVEEGQTEKGLKTLDRIEKNLHDEEKAVVAELYYNWGDIHKAAAMIADLHELYPFESNLTCFYAELLIELDKEEEAIALLEEIPASDEQYPESLLLLADLYQMQGLFEVSEQKLLNAAELLPDEPIIQFALGELYFTQGLYGKAQSYYKKASGKEHTIAGISLDSRIAESLSHLGEFEAALTFYNQIPKHLLEPDTLFGYGMTALKAGQTKTAVKHLTELKEMDPGYTSLYVPLASSFEEEGMFDEAIAAAKEGIKQDEFNKELYLFAAKLSLKLKNDADAELLLQEAVALDPGYVEAAHVLLSVYLQKEDYQAILDLVREVESYGETNPKFSWYLATAYKELEEYDSAAAKYKEASQHFESDRDFLYEYGQFLLEEGRQREALPLLKKVLHIDGVNQELEETILRIEEEEFLG
ncbi:tetratricopeptide repeat protein [Bacillus gobiensis]|uniref:tetratricopeptide repeat protein n=1 Tax=Bacillus gobiensis TaxID=1441095 RepID=UPI003D208798